MTVERPDAAEFEAAGLYDPAADGAAERLELLRYLASQGLTVEDMAAAGEQLVSAAGDRALFGSGRLRLPEVAAAAGAEPDRVRAVWQAAGLAPPGEHEAAFADDDVELVRIFEGAAALFGDAAALQITRVIGASVARIADAAASLFLTNVEGPLLASGGTPAQLAAVNVQAVHMLLSVPAVVDRLFRHHAQVAIRRSRMARDADMPYTSTRTAVGFVDLVAFTERSQHLDLDELSAAVDRFEAAAVAAAARVDGRVVKSMGDEVMFVAIDPADACRVALELCATVDADPVLGSARGAVGHGLVLSRDGDVYGPVVNVAARAVKAAPPGTVVATAAVVAAVGDTGAAQGVRFGTSRTVSVRGVDEPVELVEVGPAARGGR